MICVSIGNFGLDACRKALKRCEKYRRQFPDLVAEIRMDLCGLGEDEVRELFSESRIPLIATGIKRSMSRPFWPEPPMWTSMSSRTSI